MKRSKKLIALLLTLIMAFSMIPLTAMASDTDDVASAMSLFASTKNVNVSYSSYADESEIAAEAEAKVEELVYLLRTLVITAEITHTGGSDYSLTIRKGTAEQTLAITITVMPPSALYLIDAVVTAIDDELGNAYEIDYAAYTDENAQAEAATIAVQAFADEICDEITGGSGDRVEVEIVWDTTASAFMLNIWYTANPALNESGIAFDVTVAPSNDTTISGITVAGKSATVDPSDETVYTVTVPYGTTVNAAAIIATATDANATVATPTLQSGVWEIEVTAEDGTVETYTLTVTVSSAPVGPGVPGGTTTTPAKPENKDDEDENVPEVTEPEIPVAIRPFDDVHANDWFNGDVNYVYENGLMVGTASRIFSPNAGTTRAMIVTILYRLEGEPSVGKSDFTDVSDSLWYSDAIAWGQSNGIIDGWNGMFRPNDTITRQELATVLARYANYIELVLPTARSTPSFADQASIADYATLSVEALYRAGVINGKNNNRFDPAGIATRAEVAAMLHRFAALV